MIADSASLPSGRFLISVIVPIYNEENSIASLCERLLAVLRGIGRPFEIVAVNDGSKDASLARLREAARNCSELKIVSFRRNYGQTAAIMAGIDHAAGDVIVMIDADLQNAPEDIPALIDKLNEGFDVVSGWRKERKDAAIRRNFVSRVANRIISWVSGVNLHDYGCTLKAYRHDVVKDVRLYGEMHRFIPIYASWQGAKVCEMPVQHFPRQHGMSKYGLERVIKVILDLIVVKFLDRHFVKPIYVFGGFGMFFLLLSAVSGLYMLYLKFFESISIIQTPLPLLSAMSFIMGIISILLGLLAEMLVRTYFESQGRKAYLVRELINFADKT